jgi:hypothetical protein
LKPTIALVTAPQDGKSVFIGEQETAEIYEASVKNERLPGQPTVLGKDWEDARKKVVGKKQISWVFKWDQPEAPPHCVRVVLKNRKLTAELGSIFSLPPVLSYEQANGVQHRKVVRFYPVTNELMQDDVKKGFQQALPGSQIDHNAPPQHVIPLTKECSVEETIAAWPFIQTVQAFTVGRKKGNTVFTRRLCDLLEQYCANKNGEVTLGSIGKNLGQLTKKIYAILQFTRTAGKRLNVPEELSRTLLSTYCEQTQRAVRE